MRPTCLPPKSRQAFLADPVVADNRRAVGPDRCCDRRRRPAPRGRPESGRGAPIRDCRRRRDASLFRRRRQDSRTRDRRRRMIAMSVEQLAPRAAGHRRGGRRGQGAGDPGRGQGAADHRRSSPTPVPPKPCWSCRAEWVEFCCAEIFIFARTNPIDRASGPRLNLRTPSGGSEGVRTSMVRRRNESHRRLGRAPAAMQPVAVEMRCFQGRIAGRETRPNLQKSTNASASCRRKAQQGRNYMKRRSILKSAVALAALAAVGMTSGTAFAQDKKFTIALIPGLTTDAFYITMQQGRAGRRRCARRRTGVPGRARTSTRSRRCRCWTR